MKQLLIELFKVSMGNSIQQPRSQACLDLRVVPTHMALVILDLSKVLTVNIQRKLKISLD